MDIREALYTTRAMRRVTSDPIPEPVQQRLLDAAIRAPSGGNGQAWRFMLVDDPDRRAALGALYADCIDILWSTVYADRIATLDSDPDAPASKDFQRIVNSVDWAKENFGSYPLLLFAFDRTETSGGSIFPAVWSAMLSARADGVGSSLTTVLEFKREETFSILGVPSDKGWRMACCVPLGYPTGSWGVAKRRPVHEVAYRNSWGTSVGFEIDEPLWT